MKKWMILGLSAFVIGLMSYGMIVHVESSTAANVNLTTEVTTLTETIDSNVYSYLNQEDLVNQLYEDLYPEIYEELYATYAESIKETIQTEIQAQLELMFDALLASQTISIPYDELQMRLYAVAELAAHSVVGITSYKGTEGLALGSAVIYDYESTTQTYYVITNHHVVEGGDNFRIVFSDSTWTEGVLLGFDQDVDIAIVSFSGNQLDQLLSVSPLGSSASLTKGTTLLAAGHPRGFDFYGTFTMGVVSEVNREFSWDDLVPYIQHDASINSGNSGGPIYNLDGEVVGINVSKFVMEEIDSMGFSIPIDLVKNIETSIRKMGGSFTDVSYRYEDGTVTLDDYLLKRTSINNEVTLTLPYGVTTGMIATYFVENGAMADSDLLLGDLVVTINDNDVTTYQSFNEIINSSFISGQTITIGYYSYNPMTLSYGTVLKSTTLVLS